MVELFVLFIVEVIVGKSELCAVGYAVGDGIKVTFVIVIGETVGDLVRAS